MKCPVTIRGMVNALAKKYEVKSVIIDKRHRKFIRTDTIGVYYYLYIEDTVSDDRLTWDQLKQKVTQHLEAS